MVFSASVTDLQQWEDSLTASLTHAGCSPHHVNLSMTMMNTTVMLSDVMKMFKIGIRRM